MPTGGSERLTGLGWGPPASRRAFSASMENGRLPCLALLACPPFRTRPFFRCASDILTLCQLSAIGARDDMLLSFLFGHVQCEKHRFTVVFFFLLQVRARAWENDQGGLL